MDGEATQHTASTEVAMTVPVAPIIGGGIGGFLLIVGLLALVIFCKRKQFRPKLSQLSQSSSTKELSNETDDAQQSDDIAMVSKSKLQYSQSMIAIPTRGRYSEINHNPVNHVGPGCGQAFGDCVRVSPKHRYHRHNSEISDSDSLPIVTDLQNTAAKYNLPDAGPRVSFKLPHIPSQLNMTQMVDNYYSQQPKGQLKTDAYPDILQESMRNDLHRVEKSPPKPKNSPLSKLRKSKSMRSSYKYQGLGMESQPHPLREIEQIIDTRLGDGSGFGKVDLRRQDDIDARRIAEISPIPQREKANIPQREKHNIPWREKPNIPQHEKPNIPQREKPKRQNGGMGSMRSGTSIDDTRFGDRLDAGYGELEHTRYNEMSSNAKFATNEDEMADLELGETSELQVPAMFYPYADSGVFHNPLYETMNRDNLNASSFAFNSIVYSKRIRPMILNHNEPAIDYNNTFTSQDGLRYAQNYSLAQSYGEHSLSDDNRLVRLPLYSINRSGERDSSLWQDPSQLPNSDDYYYLRNIIPKVNITSCVQESEVRTPPTPPPKPRSRTTSVSSTKSSLTNPDKTFSSSFAPQQIYFAPRSPIVDKRQPVSILRKQATPKRTVSEQRRHFDMEHFMHKRTQSEEQERLDSYVNHNYVHPAYNSETIYWPSNTSSA